VLTSGRRCSRGRLGVAIHVGVVGVPGGGVTSAPVPWLRMMLAPTARRLPSPERVAGSSAPLLLPCLSSLGSGTGEEGKTPSEQLMASRGSGSRCDNPVKAAQG
jgi:hypothetical protein